MTHSQDKTNNKTNQDAGQDNTNGEEGESRELQEAETYENQQGKEGMYKLYPREGFTTGNLHFESVNKGYEVFSALSTSQQKAFYPKGCLIAVKLSLYEDDDSPYLYKQYFCGMSKKEFLSTYCVLEVGDQVNLQRWKVTNRLFAHMNCSDLEVEETMTKKEIFVLLDKSSPNIPMLEGVVLGEGETVSSTDTSLPVATVIPWRRKRQAEAISAEVEEEDMEEEDVEEENMEEENVQEDTSTRRRTRSVVVTNLDAVVEGGEGCKDDFSLYGDGETASMEGTSDDDKSEYEDELEEDVEDDGTYVEDL